MQRRNMALVPLLTACILLQGYNVLGECNSPCTCDQSYLSDLPIAAQWQDKEEMAQTEGNHATYDDNGENKGELMKIAMCILQQGTHPQTLLTALPKDIQVLTILLGRGAGEITIEADFLQEFQSLVVLDVQGLPHNIVKLHDQLIIRSDALHSLVSLQYLSLQHVRLMGHESQDNSIKPVTKTEREGRLTFLQPNDNDIPLISYKDYKQEIQREGLATFAGLSNLLFLRVFYCNLQELHWEMFQGCGKLQHLLLEQNNLLFIPDFAFYGTPRLQTLSLAGNKLLSLQDTALAGLLELQKLDLSHNNFTHLSELSLPPFPELRVADFRYNPVQAVFPSTFEIMNGTFVLYLGGDDSQLNLLSNSFVGLSSLKKLAITNVKVPLLERELFIGMPKLSELEMTGDLNKISFDTFLEVPKLEQLVLSNCTISTISMDAFYGLHGLISLDLSNNQLTTLPPGVFDQQFSLRELLLQHNHLTALPIKLFTHVPAKMIRLDHNPWHCSCDMKQWQPSAINKVKQKGLPLYKQQCQFAYDKGSMCKKTGAVERYVYDKRVAPRCATPAKYKDWNVFHLLRKELHCSRDQQNKKAYITKKYDDYQKSIQPEHSKGKYQAPKLILEGKKEDAIDTRRHGTNPKYPKNANNETDSTTKETQFPHKVVAKVEQLNIGKTEAKVDIKSKKVRQQLELQKQKDEKVAKKENIKVNINTDTNINLQPTVVESNLLLNKDSQISKLSWKIEMEKKRQEKLKSIQF